MKPRRRDESGSALVEFVWLGILLLVPLVWIIVSVFEVQRGAFAVSAAARAAGRAYALAPDDETGMARARTVARQTLDDQGADEMPLRVRVTCTTGRGHCHDGTSLITVEISSGIDLPLFPEALKDGQTSFALDARHTVPVGQYIQAGP
ncbi:hypothetical protein [Nocardioides sp. 616]|uniref:hypothetical protein n=1 Tax=Nocardioides sp. 616 TaxID=2268090 RepID=UPI000CE410AB|nr:hypothetical protein [Nocardioides sp. 616]